MDKRIETPTDFECNKCRLEASIRNVYVSLGLRRTPRVHYIQINLFRKAFEVFCENCFSLSFFLLLLSRFMYVVHNVLVLGLLKSTSVMNDICNSVCDRGNSTHNFITHYNCFYSFLVALYVFSMPQRRRNRIETKLWTNHVDQKDDDNVDSLTRQRTQCTIKSLKKKKSICLTFEKRCFIWKLFALFASCALEIQTKAISAKVKFRFHFKIKHWRRPIGTTCLFGYFSFHVASYFGFRRKNFSGKSDNNGFDASSMRLLENHRQIFLSSRKILERILLYLYILGLRYLLSIIKKKINSKNWKWIDPSWMNIEMWKRRLSGLQSELNPSHLIFYVSIKINRLSETHSRKMILNLPRRRQ